jgi:hypothetical protein
VLGLHDGARNVMFFFIVNGYLLVESLIEVFQRRPWTLGGSALVPSVLVYLDHLELLLDLLDLLLPIGLLDHVD